MLPRNSFGEVHELKGISRYFTGCIVLITVMAENLSETLEQYIQACIAVAKLLNSGADLSEPERLSLENNLAIVQLNYRLWLRVRQRVA